MAAIPTPTDHGSLLPSRFPALELAIDSVELAVRAGADLESARLGGEPPRPTVDPIRVAAAITPERVLEIDGHRPAVWAELSGFFASADGWVRTHANYPHHRERLLAALGLPFDADADRVRRAIESRGGEELEASVAEHGGVLARVRSEAEWRGHAQSEALVGTPLVARAIADHADARRPAAVARRGAPLAGTRVLDLSRVIAGPVATRTLAHFGADVLRIDSPFNREFEWQHLETGIGKRSTLLDLGRHDDRARFEELLGAAHVVVLGYRPHSLEKYGLAPSAIVDRHPGVTIASISAWGSVGPFAARRGFDSTVQAATGIALAESPDGVTPGALPAQALDHATGALVAAGIIASLRDQLTDGGTRLVEASLARTAIALLDAPRHAEAHAPATWTPTTTVLQTASGSLVTPLPAAIFDGVPLDWTTAPVPWGSSTATWSA